MLKENYNPDNMFKKKENNMQMVEYKETLLKKIINKILKILRIN